MIVSSLIGILALLINNYTSKRIIIASSSLLSSIYIPWLDHISTFEKVNVNYQLYEAGLEKKAFTDMTVDLAVSEESINPGAISNIKRGIVQIPVVGGTLAFAYNYNCDLNLTQEKAVQVSMGIIRNWQELGCPPGKLTWVHRSDGAVATKLFSRKMNAFSDTWTLGVGKSLNWPAGVGGKGESGVAGIIRNIPGAIGYLKLTIIPNLHEKVKLAAIQNLSGEFLKPTQETAQIAIGSMLRQKNAGLIHVNPTAKSSYPLTFLTWVFAYETGNRSKANSIRKVLTIFLSKEFQEKAASIGFVSLGDDFLTEFVNQLPQID